MNSLTALRESNDLNKTRRFIRHYARGRSLRDAVRLAVKRLFRFTHCQEGGAALWSARQRVWLGQKTFLHWSLRDAEFDIPSMVVTADDAPMAPDQLRRQVRAELTTYWAAKTAALPLRSSPRWPPLP